MLRALQIIRISHVTCLTNYVIKILDLEAVKGRVPQINRIEKVTTYFRSHKMRFAI